uniref:Uncharacterized protein n=1 Tax=Arion vulgaris TaxID=1028688 RepID=A0A0B7AJN7_9EUPU
MIYINILPQENACAQKFYLCFLAWITPCILKGSNGEGLTSLDRVFPVPVGRTGTPSVESVAQSSSVVPATILGIS